MLIATHSGKFHADDVFGVTLLRQLYPNSQLVRTRDEARLAQADIVLDVGGVYDVKARRFDHHQNTSGSRQNGVLYSAFGLLWQEYGRRFCGNDAEVWRRIDQSLVQAIDAVDNGQDLYELTDYDVRPVTISEVIGWFTPLSATGEEDADAQFEVAVTLATQLLLRVREKTQDVVAGERQFLAAYAKSPDRHYAVLDRFVPHGHVATKQPELLYVVFPDLTGDWRVKTVQASSATFESRVPLPAAWRGTPREELARITGVDDVVFCHKAGFIAGAKSKAGALRLLALALAQPAAQEWKPAAATPASR